MNLNPFNELETVGVKRVDILPLQLSLSPPRTPLIHLITYVPSNDKPTLYYQTLSPLTNSDTVVSWNTKTFCTRKKPLAWLVTVTVSRNPRFSYRGYNKYRNYDDRPLRVVDGFGQVTEKSGE